MTAFAAAGRDPEAAVRGIESWAQGFADKARRYQEAQAETEQLRFVATSPEGGIRVTVRADGSVSELELNDRVRPLPLPQLSAAILSTMRKAQAGIADGVGSVMSEHLGGEDLQTRAVLLTNLRDRFPDEPMDLVPSAEEKWEFSGAADEPARPPVPPSPPVQAAPVRRPRRVRPMDDADDGVDDQHDPLRD